MSRFRVRAFRSLRREFLSLALLLIVPVSLAFVFPYAAIGFKALPAPAACGSHCAFVELSEKEERAVLVTARSAWQVDAQGVKGMRLELSGGELPPTPRTRVLPERTLPSSARRAALYAPGMLPSSVGAVAPVQLDTAEDQPVLPAFTREELLQID